MSTCVNGHPPEFVRLRPNGVAECAKCKRNRTARRRKAKARDRATERTPTTPLPIVFANEAALTAWQQLGGRRALENVVFEKLGADVRGFWLVPRREGESSPLSIGDGLVATLSATSRPPSYRRAVLVTAVERRWPR